MRFNWTCLKRNFPNSRLLNRKKRCSCCKQRLGTVRYQKGRLCDQCFREKASCCICREKLVEVAWKDKGYCRTCYEKEVNNGFFRALFLIIDVIIFLIVSDLLLNHTKIPLLAAILFALVVSVVIHILLRKLLVLFYN